MQPYVSRPQIAASTLNYGIGIARACLSQFPSLIPGLLTLEPVFLGFQEATSQQRDVMVAEFYGREFQLFDAKGSDEVHRLGDRMAKMTPTQRKGTLRHLTIQLSPIMEKGLVDSELVHRCAKPKRAVPCARDGCCLRFSLRVLKLLLTPFVAFLVPGLCGSTSRRAQR